MASISCSKAVLQYRCGTSFEVVTSLNATAYVADGEKGVDDMGRGGRSLLEYSERAAQNNISIHDSSTASTKTNFPQYAPPYSSSDSLSPDYKCSTASFALSSSSNQSILQSPDSETAYALWKKNLPFLYNGILIQHLDWPSLSIDWLTPINNGASNSCTSYKRLRGGKTCRVESSVQRVLLGTQTSGSEPNHLIIADIKYPRYSYTEDPMKFETSISFTNPKGAINSSSVSSAGPANISANQVPQYEIKAMMLHPGDVNRALHMPQRSFVICSQGTTGNVLIYDYAKHSSNPTSAAIQPQIVLYMNNNRSTQLDYLKSRGSSDDCVKSLFNETGNPSELSMKCNSSASGSSPTGSIGQAAASPHTESNTMGIQDEYSKNNGSTVSNISEGFGLSWNYQRQGILLASNNEGRISIFDVNGTKFTKVNNSTGPSNSSNTDILQSELLPVSTWIIGNEDKYGTNENAAKNTIKSDIIGKPFAINDLMWHPGHADVFASAGDDGFLRIWDCRVGFHRDPNGSLSVQPETAGKLESCSNGNAGEDSISRYTPACRKKWMPSQPLGYTSLSKPNGGDDGNSKGVNTIAFNLFSQYIVGAGGANGNIHVFDTRRISRPLVSLVHHKDAVSRIAFSPLSANLLASVSDDGKSIIWDITGNCSNLFTKRHPWQLGSDTQNNYCVNDNILFIHAGHRESVTDISWSKDINEPSLLATVGYDNTFQAWSMSDYILWNAFDCEYP